jgi:hypothetical protein
MDNKFQEQLKEIVDTYGYDAVVEVVRKWTSKPLPTTNALVHGENLAATLYQLDTGIADILEAGTANEEAYSNKADLQKRARELDTEIQLREANAIMEIQGTGRDAFVMVGDKKVALTNDTSRDAYRHTASQDLRKELGEVEAELVKLDIGLAKSKDAYNSKVEAFQGIRIKANLQANILAFLK